MTKKKVLKPTEKAAPAAIKTAAPKAEVKAPTVTPAAAAKPAPAAEAKPALPKARPAQAFELEAPQASTVLLAGDFTGWEKTPIALNKEGNGRWKATISLAPGTYQYRFMVDGNWTDDPQAPARVYNPFGTANCVREVTAN